VRGEEASHRPTTDNADFQQALKSPTDIFLTVEAG
jgi:hypothetical protein